LINDNCGNNQEKCPEIVPEEQTGSDKGRTGMGPEKRNIARLFQGMFLELSQPSYWLFSSEEAYGITGQASFLKNIISEHLPSSNLKTTQRPTCFMKKC
jgi:hypothetical protein